MREERGKHLAKKGGVFSFPGILPGTHSEKLVKFEGLTKKVGSRIIISQKFCSAFC